MVASANAAEMAPKVESVPRASHRAPNPANIPMAVPESGNRKPLSIKNPYTKPPPTAAPRNAPKIPRPMLKSLGESRGLFIRGFTAVAGFATAADAGIGGGAVAVTGKGGGTGAAVLILTPLPPAAGAGSRCSVGPVARLEGGAIADAAVTGAGAEGAGVGNGAIIGAATTGAGAGRLPEICSLRSWLASGVPSTLQTGQLTVNGIRPSTGCTSNLYFWPQ